MSLQHNSARSSDMTDSRWTDDLLDNVMQLTRELVDMIFQELVDYELGRLLDVPTGEFTYKPHLVGLDNVFSKWYTKFFFEALADCAAIRIWCERWGDELPVNHRDHSLIQWVLQNGIFYGPIPDDTTMADPWRRLPKFDDCRSLRPLNCTCRDFGTMSIKLGEFTPVAREHERTGVYGWGWAHYAWRYTPADEISAQGLNEPGMRHTFMYHGDAFHNHLQLFDRLLLKSCPCCDDVDGPRRLPVFVNRSRRTRGECIVGREVSELQDEW